MVHHEYLWQEEQLRKARVGSITQGTYRPIGSMRASRFQTLSERQRGQEGRGSIGLCSSPASRGPHDGEAQNLMPI
jgi:hypothetical protein